MAEHTVRFNNKDASTEAPFLQHLHIHTRRNAGEDEKPAKRSKRLGVVCAEDERKKRKKKRPDEGLNLANSALVQLPFLKKQLAANRGSLLQLLGKVTSENTKPADEEEKYTHTHTTEMHNPLFSSRLPVSHTIKASTVDEAESLANDKRVGFYEKIRSNDDELLLSNPFEHTVTHQELLVNEEPKIPGNLESQLSPSNEKNPPKKRKKKRKKIIESRENENVEEDKLLRKGNCSTLNLAANFDGCPASASNPSEHTANQQHTANRERIENEQCRTHQYPHTHSLRESDEKLGSKEADSSQDEERSAEAEASSSKASIYSVIKGTSLSGRTIKIKRLCVEGGSDGREGGIEKLAGGKRLRRTKMRSKQKNIRKDNRAAHEKPNSNWEEWC